VNLNFYTNIWIYVYGRRAYRLARTSSRPCDVSVQDSTPTTERARSGSTSSGTGDKRQTSQSEIHRGDVVPGASDAARQRDSDAKLSGIRVSPTSDDARSTRRRCCHRRGKRPSQPNRRKDHGRRRHRTAGGDEGHDDDTARRRHSRPKTTQHAGDLLRRRTNRRSRAPGGDHHHHPVACDDAGPDQCRHNYRDADHDTERSAQRDHAIRGTSLPDTVASQHGGGYGGNGGRTRTRTWLARTVARTPQLHESEQSQRSTRRQPYPNHLTTDRR